MTLAQRHLDILLRGKRLTTAFETVERQMSIDSLKAVRVSKKWDKLTGRHINDLVIVSYLREFTQQEFKNLRSLHLHANNKRFLMIYDKDDPVETLGEDVVKLDVHSPKRLHLTKLVEDNEVSLLRRLIAGMMNRNSPGSILDAWWDKDEFVVISPTFERLRMSLDQLPKLRDVSRGDLQKFQIDEFGDFVYWPSHDVHIGWAQFEQAAKPAASLRARQKDMAFNKRYGNAMRKLREQLNLKQDQMDGLDERSVRRIEHGETRATSHAIAAFSKAHHMNVNEYMNRIATMMLQ